MSGFRRELMKIGWKKLSGSPLPFGKKSSVPQEEQSDVRRA
jgi:hypothetical protein